MRPLRLVVDTNVWLDWLVFNDPAVLPLRNAAADGQIEVFIDAACEAELARVLAYRRRGQALAASVQSECLARCRAIARQQVAKVAHSPLRLPVCRDADDQKFLELARGCDADYLVTRDRALLALDLRRIRRLPFGIVTPAGLAAVLEGASPRKAAM